jgi:polyphosphate kinase 2 (PPK2 family)
MVKKQVLTPKQGKQIKLADFDPDYHGDWIKQTAKEAETDLEERLDVLQEKLYAQSKYALLVVLQAMDASARFSLARPSTSPAQRLHRHFQS